MLKAVKAVPDRKMGWKKTVKTYRVPRSTLKRYVRDRAKTTEEVGRKPILRVLLEKELVSDLLVLESSFFDFTTRDMRRMIYQLALHNNLSHLFNMMKETSGRFWKNLFL